MITSHMKTSAGTMAVTKILKVLLFIAKQNPKQLVTGSLITTLVYVRFGLPLASLSAIASLLYLFYNLGDLLLYNYYTPKDSRTNVQSPSEFDLPYESLYITTDDGVRINAVLIKRPEPESRQSPTMVYFHGNSGNVGHRLPHVVDLYHHCRCNLLLVEYRGFGLSGGYPSEKGLCLDARAGLDYVLQRPDLDSNKIIVFGRSLGGAVSIDLVANSPNRSRIAALVVENTFTTLPNIARKLFPALKSLPDWTFKNQFRSIEKVKKITIPVLFVSGLSDETVPPPMMTALYNRCASTRKQLSRFEGGNHKYTYKCDNYYQAISEFLKEFLGHNNKSSTARTRFASH